MKKRVDGARYSGRSTYTFFTLRRLRCRYCRNYDDGKIARRRNTLTHICVTPLNICRHLHALLHELRPANWSIRLRRLSNLAGHEGTVDQ